MKKLLILGLAALFVALSAGTSYSTEGPSQTVVFPLICEVPQTPSGKFDLWTPEHLDMVFHLANTTNIDLSRRYQGYFVSALVRNAQGVLLRDFAVLLSPYGMSENACLGIIRQMPTSEKNKMIQTVGGKQYYVGYITYDASAVAGALLIGWAEMETLSTKLPSSPLSQLTTKLFTDTGFNGVPDFLTDINAATTISSCDSGSCYWNINANQRFMPRYKIANSDPNTYNWWIVMTPSDASNTIYGSCTRVMDGIWCDENEHCMSEDIPLPYQVNIINVADYVPAGLFPATTFPKSGFAMFDVRLTAVGSTEVNPCGNAGNEQYLGWSYEHSLGKSNLETALIFPMHRQIVSATSAGGQ